MKAPSARKPRGRNRLRAPLSRAVIVEAAVNLAETKGIDQLGMRPLAAALGVDPMAIYHHVDGKEALVRAVVADIFGRMELPPEDGGWSQRFDRWAHAYRDLARRYPGITLGILTHAEAVGAAADLIAAPLIRALCDAGLGQDDADDLAGVVVDYLNGFTLAERNADARHSSAASLDRHFQKGLKFLRGGIERAAADAGRARDAGIRSATRTRARSPGPTRPSNSKKSG
jgi:TetR/AcrR family tetracycline transcriptional repressor